MKIKLNTEYEVLTPNGFKDFFGIKQTENTYNKIIFNNGEEIGVTDNHIFIDINNRQLKANELNVGDCLQGTNGELVIESITKIDEITNVYDLIEVADGNIYYTNNILSHNCAFIGSGDNVIEGQVLRKQEEINVIPPIYKDTEWENNLWVWQMPQKGHRYLLGCDVSRGDSEDATGMCIIDYDTFEQVLEYHGKVPPDIAAQLVDHYGRMYNALSTFDITGGMGIAATQKLKELNYPKSLLHYDNVSENDIYFVPSPDAIPGINFASKNRRSQIIAALEEAVSRGDFKIRSERLIAELKKFIYKNGRPDHMKGSHDDLIMALGMCLFVANTSFKRLHESDNMTKAMLDSWKTSTTTYQKTPTYIIEDTTITTQPKPGKIYNNPTELSNNNNNLKNTRDFSWLFS
jgi:hypothetical protein